MSQDEIKAWLQENPGWHQARAIIRATGINQFTAWYGLKQMRKHDQVEADLRLADIEVRHNGKVSVRRERSWFYRARKEK